jgi:group I intron endonuclease
MEKICGIYKITSPSGRVYIGESADIFKRMYYYKILSCKSQNKLYSSLNKYGWEAHTFEVIEECRFDELLCRERHWQDFYNVLNGGLNCKLTECGGLKQVHSEDTLQKLRVAKPNLRGENHHNWGKPMSKKAKENLSRVQKERYMNNPEIALNTSKIRSGKGHRQYGIPIPNYQKDSIRKKNSKIVLCIDTGIFYCSALEASVVYNIKYSTLRSMLNGTCKNKTNLIYC